MRTDTEGVKGDGIFLSRPTSVMQQYLRHSGVTDQWYLGRLSMALEILTVVKALEMRELQAASLVANTAQTAGVLRMLLVTAGLLEAAEEWYEQLGKWQRVQFVEVEASDEGPDVDASHDGIPDPGNGQGGIAGA